VSDGAGVSSPRRLIPCVAVLLCATLALACVGRQARTGQRLFAGCDKEGVDDRATLRKGVFVCEGKREQTPFGGNGRACGTCHMPGDNFGISPGRIAAEPADSPLVFDGLDEDLELLRAHGLIHVITPDGLDEFRQTPKLVHLAKLCDRYGKCDALGLRADRTQDLCTFSRQAVANHMAKTTARIPGVDFQPPSDRECRALVAYMLSRLVSGQDERTRKR